MKKLKKIQNNIENNETYKYIKDCNFKRVNKRKLASLALAPMIICGSIIGTATNVKASQIEDSYHKEKETGSIIYVDENTNELTYQANKNNKINSNLLFIDSEEDKELFDYIMLGVSCTALGVAVAGLVDNLSNRRRR